MRLIITDVTEMHGSNYCVAGWDAQAHRMVRPLPNGGNWTGGLLQPHGVSPGATVDVNPTGQQPASAFPHRNEDTFIGSAGIQLVNAGPLNWSSAAAPPTQATVNQAFGGHLAHTKTWNGALQGVYVPETTQVGSLSAVRVPVAQLQLFEDDYRGKTTLRAYINDGAACYNLPIVAKNLREAYRLNSLAGVQQLLPAQGSVHVRLGLARAWAGQPGKCALMINGIYG